jgi:ribonuclease HI
MFNTNITAIIRATSHKWWGSAPSTNINLYKALVRSRADYASFYYSSASNTLLIKLERLQNSILRLILGAFPSTPIPALQTETGTPPLTDRRQILADKYLLKKLQTQNDNTNSKVQLLRHNTTNPDVSDSLTNKYQLVNSLKTLESWSQRIKTDLILPCHSVSLHTSNFQPTIFYTEITREDRAIPNLATQLVLCIQNTICNGDKLIYTDGSKSAQGVGAAFYYPEKDLSQGYALPIESSIFTAEAFAIIIAIKFILQQQHSQYAILTDSKSVLQALQGNCLTSSTNWLIYDIKSRLQTGANLGKSIKLIWVPGHAEILGNEVADQKAKFMSKSQNIINLPLPYTDIIPHLISNNIKLWKALWEET